MKYSVIICTYKNILQTRQCLDSVIPYLTAESECIVIDDGSNNGMAEVLNAYSQKHHSIRTITHSDNKGLIVRRNEGLRYATGDYLLFLDNDTVWKGNVLSYLSRYVDNNPSCGIVGMCGILMPDVHTSIHIHQSNLSVSIPVQAVTGYCLMVKREVLLQGVIFEQSMKYMFHEDVDFCFEASARGYTIHAVAQVPLIHYEHGTLEYYKNSKHEVSTHNWGIFVRKWSDFKGFNPDMTTSTLKPLMSSGRKIIRTTEIGNSVFFDLL